MSIDMLFLSRLQFAFTISFHILFPAFSIGLVTFLAIMEGVWLKTRDSHYLAICRFWLKVFALTFGMGIVSGVVMEFQLGTNWAGFAHQVGSVLGSLFTYEVLTAFFIEAGFLGIMIFGWDKVGPKSHYIATLAVVLGVTLSAFWIMAANSWMQTPAGVMLTNGTYRVVSWSAVIFNHSTLVRFIHMLLSCYLATAFVIIGVSAYYLTSQKHEAFAKRCLSFSLWAILLLVPIQIGFGDLVGVKVHQYQPLKTAAIEGVWETQQGAPLLLFAYPSQEKEKNYFSIGIPKLASLINTHHLEGKLIGLKSVPKEDRPQVAFVFYSFRIMVVIGFLMLALAIWACWLRYRERVYEHPQFLKACILMSPSGFIAVMTGWFTAEIGRQPWVVYQQIKIAQSVSNIELYDVVISFVLIVIVYGVIFGVYYRRYLLRTIEKGPESAEVGRLPFAYLQPDNQTQGGADHA